MVFLPLCKQNVPQPITTGNYIPSSRLSLTKGTDAGHGAEKNERIAPFLKWAGGKRWLAQALQAILANPKGTYVEPFLGSGAAFFSVPCARALLGDINADLINAYRVVRDEPGALLQLLQCLSVGKRLFRQIRRERCYSRVACAARLLYLNRTAFNGLYRVNREGEFNVPFGCKANTKLFDRDNLLRCSEKLRQAVLLSVDFRLLLSAVQSEDTVFIDPPYTVKHDNNGFRRYNEQIFSWDDQLSLARWANSLAKDGVRIVISNASHDDVAALYSRKYFKCFLATRTTNMAADRNARGKCHELLLFSQSANESLNNADLASRLQVEPFVK